MSNNGYKVNWPMRIAGILLCLVLVSFHFTSGLYARYTTRGEGEDSARVAKFTVDVNSNLLQQEQLVTLDIVPGEKQYKIEIVNNSEVAVECVVKIVNITKNIPMTFAFDGSTVNSEGVAVSHTLSSNTTEYVDFSVCWTANEDALNYIGMVDLVSIELSVQQVD